MPVIIDLMENEVIRTICARAEAEGRQKGMEQGLEKGIEKGIEQGMSEGRAEGERRVLIRQLEKRFGTLSADALQKIRQADSPTLEAWALSVLDARSIDEVLN